MSKTSHLAFLKPFITPLIAGIVLTVLAPYGTGQFSLFPRFLYWIGLCLAGGTGAVAADKIFSRRNIGEAHWQRALIQSVGATIAVAPFVLFIHTSGELKYVFVSLFYIWVIAIVIAIIAELLQQRMTSSDADIASPPLLERLPPKFREAPLYAISSEDHYVRIHSAAGEHMLLMRLSDAEDLASPIIGLKPHRSWWVAETGVDKVEKSQGKLQIHLKSGTHVPVSREGAKRVRKAGWI